VTIEIMPFIDDMAKEYNWADIIVCRSGALTISEIAAAGVASILVPYPYAVDDHQTANAHYLSDNEAAILIQQDELSAQQLAALFASLDQSKLLKMAINARQLRFDNAAEKVAQQCIQWIN